MKLTKEYIKEQAEYLLREDWDMDPNGTIELSTIEAFMFQMDLEEELGLAQELGVEEDELAKCKSIDEIVALVYAYIEQNIQMDI